MLKLFKKNRKLVSGLRSRGVPIYQDCYTMKIEAEHSGPRHLSGFEGIPVDCGSGFEGFHCIYLPEGS